MLDKAILIVWVIVLSLISLGMGFDLIFSTRVGTAAYFIFVLGFIVFFFVERYRNRKHEANK